MTKKMSTYAPAARWINTTWSCEAMFIVYKLSLYKQFNTKILRLFFVFCFVNWAGFVYSRSWMCRRLRSYFGNFALNVGFPKQRKFSKMISMSFFFFFFSSKTTKRTDNYIKVKMCYLSKNKGKINLKKYCS